MEKIEEVTHHKVAYHDSATTNGGINGLHIDEDEEETGEDKGRHLCKSKVMVNGHACQDNDDLENRLQQLSMQCKDSNDHSVQSNGSRIGADVGAMPPLVNGDLHKLDPQELCLNLPVTNLIAEEEDEQRTSDKMAAASLPRRDSKLVLKDKLPPPKESLLLRLFESKLLDASIAITHLYKSKEPGVQTYIGKLASWKLKARVGIVKW